MDYAPKIESLLGDFCDEKITQAAEIDDRYAVLWREIKQYLQAGGKRMRPRLVLLAYDAYEGKDEEAIAPIAAAWELLHACLLVHDDIIDRDLVRHGHPNLAGRYQSIYGDLAGTGTDHYALSAALLGGDLLLMSTYELASTASISSDEKLLVHSYLNKALFAVAGGELIDTDSALYPIEKSNPLSVAEYKTASYSLQLPLQCGAALAGAPSEELEKLSLVGLHTGIAFQLRDDLLGIFGDSAVTGKSNRSDISEKKRTFLINEAFKSLGPDEANTLARLYTSDRALSNEEVEEVVRLIIASGAKETTARTVEDETREALEVIDTLNISGRHKELFLDLVSKLTTRSS